MIKGYELTFNEEGQSADHELNVIAANAGYNSARDCLYRTGKWSWDIEHLKKRLAQIKPGQQKPHAPDLPTGTQ